MRNVLFLLAHQDDEYFAAPWIQDEMHQGNAVTCVYLTNGGSKIEPAVRDSESLSGLKTLAVPESRIAFLGSRERIPDGELVYNLERARGLAVQWLQSVGFTPDRIYAPDYEGGHADHDATHLVALALADGHGITSDSWSFAMYNAYGCPRPAFRALKLLRRPGARTLRYSLRTGIRFAALCLLYRSQRRTWLGLLPESAFRRIFIRSEGVNRMDPSRVASRPHDGSLLYERMFGTSYSEFSRAAAGFLLAQGLVRVMRVRH